MLISKEVEVVFNNTTYKYYNSLGYKGKSGEKVIIKVSDLKKNSTQKVKVKCDYCGEIYETAYRNYIVGIESEPYKNCCSKCTILKMKEIMLSKYGETSSQRIDFIKEKTQETNLKKYGTKEVLSSKDIRDKIEKTNLKKYGSKSPLSNKEIKEKAKNTLLEKYGVDNVSKNEEIKKKISETNEKRYGVKRIILQDEYVEKFGKYIKSSKCQDYLCALYKGELNVYVKGYFLDILLENNIYCEYDGTGHNWAVKRGIISNEKFKEKELQRYHILKRNGYKLFKIIQNKEEKLPNDDILLKMKDIAKYFLIEENYNWINFDLNKNKIILKDKEIDFDYGIMKKI